MSCENFEHPTQNKRYLSDLVDSLIVEAKDTKDTFEDVPFDFRHHKPKIRPRFPQNWVLTKDRKAMLDKARDGQKQKELKRVEEGGVMDGLSIIEGALKGIEIHDRVPDLVPIQAKKGGKTQRLR